MKKLSEHFSWRTYLLFAALLLAALLLGICVGSVDIPLGDTVTALWNSLWGLEIPAGISRSIILNIRLPRVLNVALVGAALSLCGAAMQGLLRNPLADGSTLGVSSGASLGAVLALALGVAIPGTTYGGTVIMAMAFAFLSLAAILGLAYALDRSLSTNSIILIGVIFSMFASSVISLVISFASEQIKSITFWTMGSLAGPNGAGKSTLIETIAQGVPYTGAIELEGLDVRRCKPAHLARKIGVLSQKNSVGYGYTVEEVVSLGRYAYTAGFFSARDDDGKAQVERALELTGLTALRKASVLTLSGGELQRTFLAQVFAQDPQILILDEPANHLDLVYQKHIFSLIEEWLKTPGRAVMSVVHDLSLARRYGTHAVLMNHGRCVAHGEIGHVLTPENLQAVYGMDVYAWMHEMLTQWQ